MAKSTVVRNTQVSVGDSVRIYQRFEEEGKTRTQVFEGVIIAIKGRETGKSVTVRKVADGGIGVERTWPIDSPGIAKVELVKKGHVRRSKLYFLRQRTGKLTMESAPTTQRKTGRERQSSRKTG